MGIVIIKRYLLRWQLWFEKRNMVCTNRFTWEDTTCVNKISMISITITSKFTWLTLLPQMIYLDWHNQYKLIIWIDIISTDGLLELMLLPLTILRERAWIILMTSLLRTPLITHFVWYLEKEKWYNIETLSINRVLNKKHFYEKIMQKMCMKS